MEKQEMTEILAGLLAMEADIVPEVDMDAYRIEVSVSDPMMDQETVIYSYQIMDHEKIRIKKRANGQMSGAIIKSFREIIWRCCRLERVCYVYRSEYEKWKAENNGIDYIETRINNDADGVSERGLSFIKNFWKEDIPYGIDSHRDENMRNLRLLLAEYGVGKSSYCQGIRRLAAEEIKKDFLGGSAAFPFVFDLNRFRSGDFDKFIETEMYEAYKVSINYKIFEKLCQNGIFMVILDAWDQMRSAGQIHHAGQDIKQMKSLWGKRGRAVITCRRSFYQQQLKIKGTLSKDTGLYKLNGFDEQSAIEYIQKSGKEIHLNEGMNVSRWIKECWKYNSDLLEKPLNLRLLVNHFDVIYKQVDFVKKKEAPIRFLEIVYQEWKRRNDITDESFLKELVSQTLRSGLNRSIPISRFQTECAENNCGFNMEALRNFEFVQVNDKDDLIEFCLAAYQEFTWAHFVLEELKADPEKLDKETALIRNYLLIREAREWICSNLSLQETYCLKEQLKYVKFKDKGVVRYCGSNALTLLCDMNRIPYYKKQFEEIKSDLCRRPLMGTDFHGMNLAGADFHGSDLEGANFSYTNLDSVDFTNTDLAQTLWDEHGEMKKCAFLNQSNALCVVAGTHHGGVLTYGINDKKKEIWDLQNDVINDLAGDRGGIYTASSDGWVGYIDKDGNLRNAYIAQAGLQSIAHTKNASSVYVGAENQEIYKYNWSTGSRNKIQIDRELGNGEDRISDIHYYQDRSKQDYIAYTLQEKHLLVFVRLTGLCKGEVIAKGMLSTEDIKFGDICFTDDMLVYSVIGKGIFGMPVEEFREDFIEKELLIKDYRLLEMPEAEQLYLGWADKTGELMVVAKHSSAEVDKIYSVDLRSEKFPHSDIDLDWFYGRNHSMPADQIKGFSVSDDGKYVALSGEFLAVFQKENTCYILTEEPIQAKISCKEADFSGSSGLPPFRINFLKERDAEFDRIKGEEDEQK